MYTAYDTPLYVESQTGTVDGLAQAELHYVKELTELNMLYSSQESKVHERWRGRVGLRRRI